MEVLFIRANIVCESIWALDRTQVDEPTRGKRDRTNDWVLVLSYLWCELTRSNNHYIFFTVSEAIWQPMIYIK